MDRWTDQPVRIEVWSEKGTVRGTLGPVLNTYGVTFMVMHGYGSSTALYNAAQASVQDRRDRPLIILYVGDRDPSGMAMSEVDIPERIARYGGEVDVRRLAIAENDTKDPELSWFPASDKQKDPRHDWYVQRYGARCWELDALNPVVLRDRVEDAILGELDHEAWERANVAEQAEQESILRILSTWPGISRQAPKYPQKDAS
ncbi:MAG: hypothetical protein M3451_09650 [Chloroflexota bacterium]|nr:hypothetical protein [Chloroflexota bacterium]